MNVRHINTPEDYSEYRADKGLHDAYKNRVNVLTIDELVRMWVEHMEAQPPIVNAIDKHSNMGED